MEVRHESRLEIDEDVGGVDNLDWVPAGANLQEISIQVISNQISIVSVTLCCPGLELTMFMESQKNFRHKNY